MELRNPPSGEFVDVLAPYLLRADVQLGRFIPSAFPSGAGARAFMSKAFGPEGWTIAPDEKTILLPRGKYLAIWGGNLAKLNAVSVQIAIASTSGGVNMAGWNTPITAYSDYVTLPAMWEATSEAEELYLLSTSSGAGPTVSNSNLYVLRLGS